MNVENPSLDKLLNYQCLQLKPGTNCIQRKRLHKMIFCKIASGKKSVIQRRAHGRDEVKAFVVSFSAAKKPERKRIPVQPFV